VKKNPWRLKNENVAITDEVGKWEVTLILRMDMSYLKRA
jgi:hypothetical protein